MEEAELREFVTSHITDVAWQVVQFVAGLLSEREEPLTDIFTNLLPVSRYELEDQELESSKVTCWPRWKDAHLALTLCHCLYEIDAHDSAVQNKIREIGFSAVMFEYHCQLGAVDCTAIANFLKMHNEILMVNLSDNKIDCLGCKEISEFSSFSTSISDINCKLTSLNLNHNIVANEGVKYLAEALKDSNCKLNSLNLGANEFTDEGLKYLAEALKDSNCKVKSLNLAGNEFTDEGVKYLAEALKDSNCKLNNLKLSCYEFTDEGVKYLAEALKDSNCQLNSLEIWGNKTDEGAEYLAEALKHSNCKLNSLNLGCNEFTDERVKYLAEALKDSACKTKKLTPRLYRIYR